MPAVIVMGKMKRSSKKSDANKNFKKMPPLQNYYNNYAWESRWMQE